MKKTRGGGIKICREVNMVLINTTEEIEKVSVSEQQAKTPHWGGTSTYVNCGTFSYSIHFIHCLYVDVKFTVSLQFVFLVIVCFYFYGRLTHVMVKSVCLHLSKLKGTQSGRAVTN